MTAVTLTQIIRFCASGVLPEPELDPAPDETTLDRRRESDGADLETEDPDQ